MAADPIARARTRQVPAVGLASLLLTVSAATAQAGDLDNPDPPTPVVGGEEAAVCAWPSVGALLNNGAVNCTGTLVHPQVVLTAAHCVDPLFSGSEPTAIAFGEDGQAPTGTAAIADCEFHPGWTHEPDNFAKDLAYCVLDAPVTGLPLVPVLMGCEAEAIEVGAQATIVGYGATKSTLVSANGFQLEGVGPKRTLQMTIEEVAPGDEILLRTPEGGGCNGDSGGPAMIQVADGTWRVVAAASRRDVGADWMPQVGDALCPEGLGLFYGLYHAEMEWFEAATGFDLTPCHDATGAWDPGPECDQFPTDPGAGGGEWNAACSPAPLGGEPGFCEMLPPDGGTGGSTGGGSSSGGDDGGSSGTGGDEGGTTDLTSGTTGTPDPTDTDGGSSGDTDASETGGTNGCSCTTDGAPPTWTLLCLPLLVTRRRH